MFRNRLPIIAIGDRDGIARHSVWTSKYF